MAEKIAPIYVGMQYGTVSSKLSELIENAEKNDAQLERFGFKPYKKRSYKRYNETIYFKDRNGKFNILSKDIHTVNGKKLFDYEYNDGTARYFGYNRKQGDESFDTIVTGNYIAHDRNHNGIVDEGEIKRIN